MGEEEVCSQRCWLLGMFDDCKYSTVKGGMIDIDIGGGVNHRSTMREIIRHLLQSIQSTVLPG